MLHDTLLLVIGLLVAILLLTSIATRVPIPYAVLLVLGGALISAIPGLPNPKLDPELILLLFLPPLIFSSAWSTSWREFRANLHSILLLAIGLVLATVVLVAVVAHTVVPGLSWPVAFVLGAVVSPTDAVAASATTQSMGISRKVVAIIEGESLVNDATGLVAYSFAIAAVVSGTFSLGQASLQLVVVSVGGIALGLIVAWMISWLHRAWDDALREITLTLLTPFAVYLLAEAIGFSGVLAAMAAGLYLARKSAIFFSATTRLQAYSFWNVLIFLFNGFVFLLIGLQLRPVLDEIGGRSLPALIWYGALVSITVILIRLAWVFAAFSILHFVGRLASKRSGPVNWRNILVVGWTGMRGGVSLAAALAIPTTMASGIAFPDRDQVIFLTFCVILATLVVQGLSLSPLIRLLGLQADTTIEQETRKARLASDRAALARLDELAQEDWVPAEYLARLRRSYQHSMHTLVAHADEPAEDVKERFTPYQRLQQEALQAQRMTIIQLRNKGTINDEVLHRLERELDLTEERLK